RLPGPGSPQGRSARPPPRRAGARLRPSWRPPRGSPTRDRGRPVQRPRRYAPARTHGRPRRPRSDRGPVARPPPRACLLAAEEARDLQVGRVVGGGPLGRDRLTHGALDPRGGHDRGGVVAVVERGLDGFLPLALELAEEVALTRRAHGCRVHDPGSLACGTGALLVAVEP